MISAWTRETHATAWTRETHATAWACRPRSQRSGGHPCRSRPGRERPTPRPGLAVLDPNGLEVTRADLGLDERDPRHGLGLPSPIPAGLEIVPFENQIAAALGASLGLCLKLV
ncbi:hypothetical protein FCV25MIE_24034 [Fagus crenata]